VCCFSVATPLSFVGRLFAPRLHVSKTNLFARMVAPGRQALAYGMDLDSAREIAMILPVPVVPNAGDDALKFVSLEQDPRMFDELALLFAPPVTRSKGGLLRSASIRQTLVVHDVGAFVASYVPSRADFDRLDPRFRMPSVLFDAVPAYADYGFAVFQLKPGKVTVHPMAMTFPTRAADQLFFPTVHVHDGRFHAVAKFDHALYYQRAGAAERGDEAAWMKPQKSYAALVDVEQPMARRTLHAKLPNADVWIAT
jgi:hypothetical protein